MSLLIGHFYRFGEFTLDTDQRVLLREGKPVPLAPKVFDTLLILVEHNGRIVGKEELMNRLWPDTFVEEANLTFNIQQLRKSLRDNARKPIYIETIARRGYRFIANLEEMLRGGSGDGAPDSRQFQVSNARAGEPGVGAVKIEDYELQPVVEPPSANSPAIREPAAGLSTHTRRSMTALPAMSLIVLAFLGALIWKRTSDSHRADGKLPSSPLKIEKLTLTGQSRQVVISPDGKYIAYTRAIDKRHGIWLRQLATNTNVEIVPATGIVHGLAFANSGEFLYFVRGDPTALYRVSLLGGVPTRIVDNLEGNFSISPDDSQLAFIRKVIDPDGRKEYSLITANSRGGGERTLLARMYPDKLEAPVWSPDGQSIICAYGSSEGGSQSTSIAEVRLSDGSTKELSSERFFNIGKIAWSPHKSGLVIAARKNAQDNKELWRVSYPDMKITQITEGLSPYLDLSVASTEDRAVASQATRLSDLWVGSSREPRSLKRITQAIDEFCWTPNGRLLYQSTASGNRDLWITQPDGTEQRQLTNDSAVDGTPAVTPDNRYIVFTSNRTGALQIWRMNLDGSNQIQLTHGSSANYPAVSPDGKSVFFNTTDDWRLWRVSIDGGEPAPITQYAASVPSVSPDGKMIACVGRNEPRVQLSILIVPIEGGQPIRKIDVTGAGFSTNRIQWTKDGRCLLYAAEREGPTVLFKQPLEGGSPEEIVAFEGGVLFDFGYSFDGQYFAVTRGEWRHDIVLIDGFNRR